MRVQLLIAVAALTASCSSDAERTSATTILEYSIEAPATSALKNDGPRVNSRSDSQSALVGADLDAIANNPGLVVDSPSTARFELNPYHQDPEAFTGPFPLLAVPSRFGDPLDLFVWVGHASLNYGPDQPFPDPRLRALLSPTLLPARTDATEPALEGLTADSSRAVLLDAWINAEFSTSTLVRGVAIFERTLGTGDQADPRIEVVSIDLTAHAAADGWQIIELRATS